MYYPSEKLVEKIVNKSCCVYNKRNTSCYYCFFRQEVDWLLSFLRNVPSPVVFSHNDINCGNILVSIFISGVSIKTDFKILIKIT